MGQEPNRNDEERGRARCGPSAAGAGVHPGRASGGDRDHRHHHHVPVLVAAGDARRRAEEDATLALIAKLESAINDRLDALLQTRPDPNRGASSHYHGADIYPSRHSRGTSTCGQAYTQGPGHRLVRFHQERAARRLLRAEHNRSTIPSTSRPTPTRVRHGTTELTSASGELTSATRRWPHSLAPAYGDGNLSPTLVGNGHLRRLLLRGRGHLQEPGLPARGL